MPEPELVVVGRFGAPFGVHGWVHCQSYTSPPENLVSYSSWFAQASDQRWQAVGEVATKRHKKAFIAKLESHPTRETAMDLRGAFIGVPVDVLPELQGGEYYWHDLVGCEVRSQSTVLGVVKSIMETGANDVLVVKTTDGECLIPYVEPYVVSVDAQARLIQVEWQPEWLE